MNRKAVVIAAGGTGGHVFPGIALAENLRSEGFDVHWIGTTSGIESDVVPNAGFTFHYLQMQGFRGKQWYQRIAAIFYLMHGCVQLIVLMRRLKVQCVIGMGGFASASAGLAAFICGVPLLLQEQNAVMGTTNKMLSIMAKKIFTGFSYTNLPAKFVYSGNPLRREIVLAAERDCSSSNQNSELHVLVLGGSLGASVLNKLLPEVLAMLAAQTEGKIIKVLHQTGDGDYSEVLDAYSELNFSVTVKPFIDDMAVAYARAEVIVARAGALTVSELACFGINAVLVPYPHAIDDHQLMNARWLSDRGLATLICQQGISKESLLAALVQQVNDDSGRHDRSEKIKAMCRRDAVSQITAEVKRCAGA